MSKPAKTPEEEALLSDEEEMQVDKRDPKSRVSVGSNTDPDAAPPKSSMDEMLRPRANSTASSTRTTSAGALPCAYYNVRAARSAQLLPPFAPFVEARCNPMIWGTLMI
jgi:hypothetical protein